MTRAAPAADLSQLWLETLQSLADRAAHEIKGALNGVALNVEVVRSRVARGACDPAAVAPYAAAAAEQMESLTSQMEALLALARPARPPADVAAQLRRLLDIAQPVARAQGGELVLDAPAENAAAIAAVPAEVLRLALAALVRGALEAFGRVSFALEAAESIRVAVRGDGAAPRLRDDIAAALADAGVQVEQGRDGVTLAFAHARGADSGDL